MHQAEKSSQTNIDLQKKYQCFRTHFYTKTLFLQCTRFSHKYFFVVTVRDIKCLIPSVNKLYTFIAISLLEVLSILGKIILLGLELLMPFVEMLQCNGKPQHLKEKVVLLRSYSYKTFR